MKVASSLGKNFLSGETQQENEGTHLGPRPIPIAVIAEMRDHGVGCVRNVVPLTHGACGR